MIYFHLLNNLKFVAHIPLGAEMMRRVIHRHQEEFFTKYPKVLFQEAIKW